MAFVGVTETRGGRPSLLSVFRVGSALRSDRRQPVVEGSGSEAFSLKQVAKLLLAGFVILATGRGAPMFVLALALVALGEGVTNPAPTAWLGDASPQHVRGTLMAAFATAADLGGAAGPLVGYLLAAAVGLRWAYAMCAVFFITAFLVLRIHRVRPRTSTAGDG